MYVRGECESIAFSWNGNDARTNMEQEEGDDFAGRRCHEHKYVVGTSCDAKAFVRCICTAQDLAVEAGTGEKGSPEGSLRGTSITLSAQLGDL